MCAIFGIIGKNNEDLLKKISKSQIYRGPDEQNFYIDKNKSVQLGSNRLAVVDKVGGQQPMLSEDRNYVIVFNGCIFNFNEIKKFLEKKKIFLKTSSDTEVLINAFAHFGHKCFNYFDGMWACAIYDKKKNFLTLSRDYLGQKPLYYSTKNNQIIFSSQLNGMLCNKDLSLSKNKLGIAKYFIHGFFPAPDTPYNEIKQLEPGSFLDINLSNLNNQKSFYWDIASGPDHNIFFDRKISKKNFQSEFKQIIEDYSISDKKIALSLSGGTDSFLTSYFLTKKIGKTSSFSLGFEDRSYDETNIIKNLDLNLEKNIFETKNEDLKKTFLSILNNNIDPIGDSSLIPTYLIFEKIKSFSNVAITGDGGDENFFGYIIFDGFKLALIVKKFIPKFVFKLINFFLKPLKISDEYMSLNKKIKTFFLGLEERNEKILLNWISTLNLNDIEKNLNIKIDEKSFFQDLKQIYDLNNDKMKFAQIYIFKYYLPLILAKTDQASMLNSVEARSPFLSKHIINFALSEKTENIFSIFKKKAFILETFSKIIPKAIKNSKKHGFAFKKEEILKDEKLIKSLIDVKSLSNKEFFFEKYKFFLNNSGNYSNYIWHEIILNNFYKKNTFKN
jgi:asparagine synthase (glutamine-hydrolysing)